MVINEMLIINKTYNVIDSIINESFDSDEFEHKCAMYLRKQFPDHKFTVKGGNNRSVSDILVDDKFYIECKMTEHDNKICGVQSTGFGIKLNEDNKVFECSDTADGNDTANKIMSYINTNIDSFVKLTEPHTSKVKIKLDQSVFADWINSYYKSKNVEFFMTFLNNEFSIFKNTSKNICKYFNIDAYARYYSSGSTDLPVIYRDDVAAELKNKLKPLSIKFDGKKMIIKLNKTIDNNYIDVGDLKLFLSDKNQEPNEYRVMKLTCAGSPRIIFGMCAKANQDTKDLEQFKKFLSK
jgi:hypothetical protein